MSKLTLKNGVTLGYKEVGSGDKVLLSTQNFFFTGCHMELLGKPPYDYHCFLITMRGYGESDHIFDPTPQDWIKVWGEDVLAFADEIGAGRFYYTGVSHGSAAGWYTAFHRPQRLRGFVAASGVTQLKFPGTLAGRPEPDLDKIVGNREELAKISWDTFYPTKDTRRLARREACRKEHLEIMMGRRKEEFLVRSNTMSGSDAKTEEEFHRQLSEMDVPLMLLNGMLDPLSTPEKALKVASLMPGAKLVTYQHWEHAGPDECPEEAARDCDRFFRDIEGRIL
jgi:pimeloyl-ACP methyl ester carboxylesterase